jgi:aminoglycoside/choline kinase family phosphotransferase
MIDLDSEIRGIFTDLFEKWSGEPVRTISALPESGSYRLYARIEGLTRNAVAVHHTETRENEAFIGFANHFRTIGLPVPEVFQVDRTRTAYLQEDLGDTDLFTLLHNSRENPEKDHRLREILTEVVSWLPKFQIEGHAGLDYELAFPRHTFDRQSILWDLNYFKYNFLKLVRINFDEQALEDDFQAFADYLAQAPVNAFLYRDFQSRNIMVPGGNPVFIDFQGGRMGFPAYDLASLLFDAKAGFTPEEREWIYSLYRNNLIYYDPRWGTLLDRFYPGFVLIRKMQALGAFGFRGIIERKKSFLLSIPPAMANLEWVTSHYKTEVNVPELWRILCALPAAREIRRIEKEIAQ